MEATGPDGEGQGAIRGDVSGLGLSGEDWGRREVMLVGGTCL